ncbi:PhzF family phenazine biosynthesis protein [Deminuibacter soli]|uniref:PhzF family phenazine biosynthesis protein n=1 Tax=Deminuibacter soli TaxID=2291815 RepID=A0A3E1NKR2_9BACT|nr:PhzF family phenazine biosynthesis protein [Deminuibacter soli]RFM28481.1 PhzF family phenazine biosynthesis protein [Deminuibacter soli]
MITTYPIYQVDAFTNRLFGGNPAAVCPLESWLPAQTMQQLAFENNLSETAFFVKEGDQYHIRWFTPEFEIDLCGHATLASSYVIFNELQHNSDHIRFTCKSGILDVTRTGDLIELNFPARMPQPATAPDALLQGFNIAPKAVLKSRDYFLVYETEEQVKAIVPNFTLLNQLDVIGIIVTAPGNSVDFVSRFFVPNSVIGEDPVTGSAHSTLIPYWSEQLGKQQLSAWQVSPRGGQLQCSLQGNRVTMAGYGVLYMKGSYFL